MRVTMLGTQIRNRHNKYPPNELFAPLVLFCNARMKVEQAREVELLLERCWDWQSGVVFDFPTWIHHKRALEPRDALKVTDYFLMTQSGPQRDAIAQGGELQGAELTDLANREIEELIEFQGELRTRLQSMLDSKLHTGETQKWAKCVGSTWFDKGPIPVTLRYFPHADEGYPKKGFPSFLLVFNSFQDFMKYLVAQLIERETFLRLRQCQMCEKFFICKTKRVAKFCGNECRTQFNNMRRCESGELATYMRSKRAKEKHQ